jgi:hypothetical protein
VRVLLAGASGLIGSALTASLRGDRHEVRPLVRRPPSGPGEIEWHPERHELPVDALDGVDAVVCLSGAPLQPRPPTAGYKRQLLSSRVDTVGTLADAIAASAQRPPLIAASAVGYYGDKGEADVDESSPPGTDFFAQICRQWEAAAEPARVAGARVVSLRSGILLAREGGLLKTLRPIVWLGLAGRQGSGRQFQPWIAITDEVAAIRFVLDSDLSGPVNLTAPNPARNAELMSAIARAMHRPALLPVPEFVLRPVLRELAPGLLGGQRALPVRLTEAGFRFRYPQLEAALQATLG